MKKITLIILSLLIASIFIDCKKKKKTSDEEEAEESFDKSGMLSNYTNNVIVTQVNATYDFSKDLQLLLRTGATTNNASSDVKTPYSYINYGTSAAPRGKPRRPRAQRTPG